MSGAPKIRAMQIIDELEPEKRGIFGGAGLFGLARQYGHGHSDSNRDCKVSVYVQAGAGIVADSKAASGGKKLKTRLRP